MVVVVAANNAQLAHISQPNISKIFDTVKSYKTRTKVGEQKVVEGRVDVKGAIDDQS